MGGLLCQGKEEHTERAMHLDTAAAIPQTSNLTVGQKCPESPSANDEPLPARPECLQAKRQSLRRDSGLVDPDFPLPG